MLYAGQYDLKTERLKRPKIQNAQADAARESAVGLVGQTPDSVPPLRASAGLCLS